MTDLLQQIQSELDSIQEDSVKFQNGNKAAGTRVRKAMQTIKGLAQEVRVAVSAANNAQVYKVPRKRSLKYWEGTLEIDHRQCECMAE